MTEKYDHIPDDPDERQRMIEEIESNPELKDALTDEWVRRIENRIKNIDKQPDNT
jgi:tellurite resistance protein